jgi:hypothetical protein
VVRDALARLDPKFAYTAGFDKASVEIDMVRSVKALDAILNAVGMELQRSKGTRVRLTLEIEADAEDGFTEADIGVLRDNARQLKFKTESTAFE